MAAAESLAAAVLHLCPDSPLRPPDWRWQLAKSLRVEGRPPGRTRDDAYVWSAYRYQVARGSCRVNRELQTQRDRYPAHTDAYEVQFENWGAGGRKYELEARLLTGVGVEETSRRMRIAVETVIWYERLFFNLLDRLDDQSWVVHQVLTSSGCVGDRLL